MPISTIGSNALASGAVTNTKLASAQTLAVNGITFPATQSASSDANTLDDYEEGTFTPVVPATSVTYASRSGTYTKIGNVVYIFCFVEITSISGASGTGGSAIITGLPFTSSASVSYVALTTAWSGANFGATVGVTQVIPSTTTISAIGVTNNSGFVDTAPSSVWDSAGNWVKITGFYYV